MAKIRYRRIPEPALLDLQDMDLRILDMALCDLKDKVKREAAQGNATMEPYALEVLGQLHQQVLLIKLGEDSVEDSFTDEDR